MIFYLKFDVFLPLESVKKSNSEDSDSYIISGYASTMDKDLQGETIIPEGIDCNYLVENGWIDYEHNKDITIGIPTENTHVDENGLFLEAKLFKNNPYVKNIIDLYNNIKKSKLNRNLGFSVEGHVEERDLADKSIIRQVSITGVAVTKNPANVNATWELLSKSLKTSDVNKTFTAGYGITPETQTDAAAYRTESLASHIVAVGSLLASEIADRGETDTLMHEVAKSLEEKGISDAKTLSVFLQLATGASVSTVSRTLHLASASKNNLQQAFEGGDATSSGGSDPDDSGSDSDDNS